MPSYTPQPAKAIPLKQTSVHVYKPTSGVDADPQTKFKTCSVLSADRPEDSFSLNLQIASHLSFQQESCAIVSVGKRVVGEKGHSRKIKEIGYFGALIKHLSLSWGEFYEGMQTSELGPVPGHEQRTVFFDFQNPFENHFQRIPQMLDKLVLLVKPTMGSLMESYRTIKTFHELNPHMEYLMIYDGEEEDEKGSLLFEELSTMVSKHFDIHLMWLGSLHFSNRAKARRASLESEHFYCDSLQKVHTPEQVAFQHYLQKIRF